MLGVYKREIFFRICNKLYLPRLKHSRLRVFSCFFGIFADFFLITMQVFQETQKSFKWMGFDSKLKPFNRRISSILVFTFTCVLLLWIFLIYEADTDQEYMESIYCVSVGSGVFLSLASSTFITKKLYSFIDGIQGNFNESEYRTIPMI